MDAATPFVRPDLALALPEIFLLAAACTVLVIDVFFGERRRHLTYLLSLISVIGTFLIVLSMAGEVGASTFGGMYVFDTFALTLKLVVLATIALVLVYTRGYLAERGLDQGEFYLLTLFSTLGMLIIISGNHFMVVYLGLELMSLCLYALVAMNRDSEASAEAAMKYFVLGAIASGLLLYGMSILYGLTGTLMIPEVAIAVEALGAANLGLVLALVFIVAGITFKLGAVPFHMWLPDVYEGANTAVTLLVGSAPKVAAFALLYRMVSEGLAALYLDWRDMLIVLAVLSLAIGSLVAIVQTNIKRLFAYSTISHVGFLLLGMIAGTSEGYAAAMFYAIAYVIMVLAAFGILLLLSRRGFDAVEVADLSGLNERSPWYALIMLLVMISMAGVPVTIGFWAKLEVLAAIVQQDLVWLAILAVLFAVISAYYYLRIIWVMYFQGPATQAAFEAPADMRLALSLNGVAIVALGVMPGGLLAACQAAFQTLT